MLQAKANPSATQQFHNGSVDKIDPRRERVSEATLSTRPIAIFWLGSAGLLITLCIASLLNIFVAIAFAQGREQVSGVATLAASGAPEGTAPAFDPATLPSPDSIGAQTDITVFVRSGVPAEMRLAALRRAWRVDPAIRDFKGLQENDWNFNDPNSIPGFGEIGPDADVERMVAEFLVRLRAW